ncbi:uncharacterized protein FIESC28_08790 [Fusarium coffeatum]|uniref:RelA/SpoT domain-containing protein n=1 Tax=Fusarium coffeatum TaxID=231269 RepID=A0A366R6S9_9HYPO|nr:uncharacterized protein FIESC28_08790 [Fusarium coffeatum]RBR12020.1 hypothetical protein FIESC28_08790 [Fusarium coffeatum]
MSLKRGSPKVEDSAQFPSLHRRLCVVIDETKTGHDPKDAFIGCVWSEVEEEYQKLADELASVCKEELTRRDVPAAVESRVKSRASIVKSLDRREIYRQKRGQGSYKDIHEILHDLHDLVGIRIIVDYLDHLEAVSEFVTGTFHQERDPTIFSASRKVGRSWNTWFGAYECKNHHVSAKYAEDDPLSCYNGIIFETQITSLPANLYNKIAHPLLYKEEAGELSQGDEIVIDLTKGLAFCYSLCTYYKRHKLEGKAIDTYEMELMQKLSSASEGPEFESSISCLAERIPGVAGTDTKGKSIPRETLELVLISLLNQDIPNNIGQCLVDKLRREIQDIGRPRIELPAFGKARFDSQDVFQSPVCQEGTQARAIEYIHNWIGNGKEPLLWICSHAGSGKSTLARTIARDLTESGQIAAGYFFRRGAVSRNQISHVIPTIAAQLLCSIPHFEPCLRASVDACKNVDFETMRLDEQFKVLLKSPLSQVGHILSTKVIIIDALDECVDLVQVHRLIDLLVSLKQLNMVQFRLLVTSRDEDVIRAAIARQPHEKLLLATTYHDDNIKDIEFILRIGFQRIRNERGIEQTWPTEEQFREAVHRSTNPSPLFIYATTLLRFLGDGSRISIPKKRLKSWIETGVGTTFTTQLDEMYKTVFKSLDPDLGPECSENLMHDEKDTLRMILGAIALAVEPMSANSLVDILGIDPDSIELVKTCRAVLYIPENDDEPIQMLHKSFSDFLLRQIPHNTCWFNVDKGKQNELLAQGCLTHLDKRLRENICELQDPGVLRVEIKYSTIQRCIPESLRYASTYWVYHLVKAVGTDPLDLSVKSFLHKKFLQWAECLALLGRLDSATSAIEDLRATNKVRISIFESCHNVRNLSEDWNAVLQHIHLASGSVGVSAVALSPDSRLLASSHFDPQAKQGANVYIELRKTRTGAHVARLPTRTFVKAMCWTKDGANLIFLDHDGTVYRHDFLHDDPIILRSQRSTILGVAAISPTGVVAMVQPISRTYGMPEDFGVYAWDTMAGRPSLLKEVKGSVSAIAISRDSCQVAFVANETVTLANTKIEFLSDVAECGRSSVLAFSWDGTRLFFLNHQSLTVFSIHDACTRTVHTLQGPRWSKILVFPDEVTVAALDQKDLWLWSTEDNRKRPESTLHDERATIDVVLESSMRIEDISNTTMITMSPDGQYLVSVTGNRFLLWRFPECRLYKVLVPDDSTPLASKKDFECTMCFSRDGTSFVIAGKAALDVWVLEPCASPEFEFPPTVSMPYTSSYNPPKTNIPYIRAIWMNKKTMAFILRNTVNIWNLQDGLQHLITFKPPRGRLIDAFAFAPGFELLAIASDSVNDELSILY